MSDTANQQSRFMCIATVLGAAAVVLVGMGLFIGSTGIGNPRDVAASEVIRQILFEIRLPRSIGAWLAGALLGLSGAISQGLFRNALADPYLLGSASGASLAIGLSLMLVGGSPFTSYWLLRLGLTGVAFLGAILAVLVTLVIAKGVQNTLRLLLSGVIVGVVLGALTLIVNTMSPGTYQAMQSFLAGSTSYFGWSACVIMLVCLCACGLTALVFGKLLDGLILGETTARSLGLNLSLARWALIAAISLATGAAVAQAGLIAFVGLVAPHWARSLVRCSHRQLFLLSVLNGGIILLVADLLSRSLIAPQEIPVGILTALLGGVYLLWLMYKGQSRGAVI